MYAFRTAATSVCADSVASLKGVEVPWICVVRCDFTESSVMGVIGGEVRDAVAEDGEGMETLMATRDVVESVMPNVRKDVAI